MNDSNDEGNAKPYPKDSAEINDEDIPGESLDKEDEQNQEENNNNQNNDIENNFRDTENNNDNNFPPIENDSQINSGKNNENNEDNFDDNFNNDNTFKDESNINQDNNNINNNNNSMRFSNNNNINDNNDNNKYSINNNNNENQDDFEFEGDNNEEELGDNGKENNNNINNNNNNDSFGFRESSIKKEDNDNINNFGNNEFNNNNYNKNIRSSGNSDNLQLNDNNDMNNINNNNNIQKNDDLSNMPYYQGENINNYNNNNSNNTNNFNNNNNNFNNYNNNNNNNNNNNFNYARNPYSSNNNYNQNGGFGNQGNMNQTTSNFIAQDTHPLGNLNYNYSAGPSYNNNNNNNAVRHHADYNPVFEQYEELPEDSDGFPIDPNEKGKDSPITAGIQIANTIMGAGILSIPLIMSYLGLLIGIILVVFLAAITLYSVYILIRCHEITGKNGYSMFGKITLGKIGSILVKVIIIINNIGLCICYFRIFGEVLQTIVQIFASPTSFLVTNWHNFLYILIGSVIMFAFIFIKKISSLKKVAYLGVLAVFVLTITLTILLLYKTLSNKLESGPNWEFLFPDCTFTEAFHITPTVFLAFLFQFNVFPIYFSMKHRNMETMMKATKIGVGFSLIMFLFVGIVGFLIYGFDIEDTILDNLSDDMIKYRRSNVLIIILIIIICISFAVTCLTSFPILFLSLRVNYVNSLMVCSKMCKKNNEDSVQNVEIRQGDNEIKTTHINNKLLIFITIFLYVFIVVIAIVVYKLKTMFTIIGASAGSFIAFILPNVFYIIIVKMSGKNYSLILSFIILGLGLFFFIIAILMAFF